MKTIWILCCIFYPIDADVDILVKVVENSPEKLKLLESGNYKQNPEELSGQFEGDIVLTQEQVNALSRRNGIRSQDYRWPNKTVPYEYSRKYDKFQRKTIRTGLNVIESQTCVKFVERTNETDYVAMTANDIGCYSRIGRIGGAQELNLRLSDPGDGCFRVGTIMHEFIHTLGFYHMQCATDRDNYVEIKWDNINDTDKPNFKLFDVEAITNFGIEYDLRSLMHYSAYAFSNNNEPTIVPHDLRYLPILGKRQRPTTQDIARINIMYNCDENDNK